MPIRVPRDIVVLGRAVGIVLGRASVSCWDARRYRVGTRVGIVSGRAVGIVSGRAVGIVSGRAVDAAENRMVIAAIGALVLWSSYWICP
jgi:hypothetical protein